MSKFSKVFALAEKNIDNSVGKTLLQGTFGTRIPNIDIWNQNSKYLFLELDIHFQIHYTDNRCFVPNMHVCNNASMHVSKYACRQVMQAMKKYGHKCHDIARYGYVMQNYCQLSAIDAKQ